MSVLSDLSKLVMKYIILYGDTFYTKQVRKMKELLELPTVLPKSAFIFGN